MHESKKCRARNPASLDSVSRCAHVAAVGISALRLLGAVFFVATLFASSACKKAATPEWSAPRSTASALSPPKSHAARSKVAPVVTTKGAADVTPGTLRFITYNVENWLTMERQIGSRKLTSSKPATEKQAVVQILTRHAPDVIGLCEVGTAADLAEIQENLKTAGLDLPYSHHTGGSDLVRHLGLLSRFPITETAKPAETEYRLAGRTYAINRGILDVSLDANGQSYRFLGVHLKSKRDSEQGDQAAIRLNEARLLRSHLDTIFETNQDARLIVYGDFNDSRSSPAIKIITGKYNDPDSLIAIPAKDSQNNAWTHCWALHDIYSRFDFVMVSRGLKQAVDFHAAKVIDDSDWSEASDHRAVLAVFR
jgi:endonuclease/exonuclease/phosphatase family metal-dependent hydrolase